MNISLLKVNCSSICSVMANPKDNRPLTERQWEEMRDYLDREKPLSERQVSILKDYVLKETKYDPKRLGGGVKADLIKMYSWYIYGKGSLGLSTYENLATEKGTTQEAQSIKLLSVYDGVNYKKNEKMYSNRYIKGVPDIVISRKGIKKVIDIKTPIDINSFLSKHEIELPNEYIFQMRGYIQLTKADYGEVVFCLVNLPPEMIASEIRKLKQRHFLFGKSDEDTEIRIKQLQDSMVFDDLPLDMRVIKFKVERDDNFMSSVYGRVKIAREWMKQFHKKSTNRR